MTAYRVKDWDRIYENSRSRELQKLDFVLLPNKHDGYGFRSLISRPRGMALFAAWVLVLEVASKCRPRGTLTRNDGAAHTSESISLMTGGDEKTIREAMDVLCSSGIGWLEKVEIDYELPPARTATPEQKRRAHARVDRYLRPDRGVQTPKGQVTHRPAQCQWCDVTPAQCSIGQPGIVAHHLFEYGTYATDLVVIFVCRSCHGFFETGKYTTRMVTDRFGEEWTPHFPAGDSGRLPQKGIEDKGTEENVECARDKPVPIPSRPSPIGTEGWLELVETAAQAGMSFDPGESSDLCQKVWRYRDFENRRSCIDGIRERLHSGQYSPEEPQFTPTLRNYIEKNLWRESGRPRNRGQPSKKDLQTRRGIERAIHEAGERRSGAKIHTG